MYTLAAGAFAAGSAYAAPTQSTTDFPISVEGSGSAFIDVDDNGQYDFVLRVSSNDSCSFNGGEAYFDGYSYGGQLQYDSNGYAGMVSMGTEVPGTMNFTGYAYLTACNNDLGNFPVPSRGYLAISFMRGNDTHYGYLDVSTSEGSLVATVHNACFESEPGTAIEVGGCAAGRMGDTRAVPVGGLVPLSLGVLALGAAAIRRRRRVIQ